MKVGDLVKDNYPTRSHMSRLGLIVGHASTAHHRDSRAINKVFNVLWYNGTFGRHIWDCDLELVSEGR
jgi:hypothetical protein